MPRHFIIAADFKHGPDKTKTTTNYFQHAGPFFTSWSANCRTAKAFDTRALAAREAKALRRNGARVVVCEQTA